MKLQYLLLFILPFFAHASECIEQPIYENCIKDDTPKNYEYFLEFFIATELITPVETLSRIEENWRESDEILAIETLYFLKNRRVALDLLRLVEKKTGQKFGYDFNLWYEYIWSKAPTYNNDYFIFKAKLHSLLDVKFSTYFKERQYQTTIRLDEVRWGGVVQDGIPPLRDPEMISGTKASYLKDKDVVFGISVNGDIRAYPKRILAWHEMFTDTVGGTPVAGVYCTLCGTVILYETNHKGKQYNLGTSGFLYRSNKLMYDKKTQSLWNTHLGTPVIGPLVGKNIALNYLSVVTTTWGEWKERYPNTKVLSLQTGHKRDYREGVAYKNYFATDELMFNVPKATTNTELLNKQEILSIRLPEETEEKIAISSAFLKKNPIYNDVINNKSFVVFTDKSGGHRVYFCDDIDFDSYDGKSKITDSKGGVWQLYEDYLEQIDSKNKLNRLQSYNAFWFGFKAAFPDVRLVK